MNKRGTSPRNRIDELKALRDSSRGREKRTLSSRVSRVAAAANVTSTINAVLPHSDFHNNSLIHTKVSIPLLPLNKLLSFRSPRISSRRSIGLNSLNSSLNSSGLSAQSAAMSSCTRSPKAPKPPAKPKEDESFQRKRNLIEPEEVETVDIPTTPAKALKHFIHQMSQYEHAEILDYKEIYFWGDKASKILPGAGHNYNYDDDRGDYKIVLNDHIAYRYEILQVLGKGSFGQVCKCMDYKNNEHVAVKIIRNKKRFQYQAGVEVKVLETLRDNDAEDSNNIIHIRESFYFRKHMCIVFELLSFNLYELLKTNHFDGLSVGLIRRFAVQLLYCLRYTRKLKIIHCDLKPENILLKQANKSGIKVIDFGSACFDDQRVYTYIQSRFYRAPEIMLGIPYTTAIDMWSFGCILAELFTGYPLFPGESEVEQMQCIMEMKGVPPSSLLERSTRRKIFFDTDNNPKLVANSRGKIRKPSSKTLVEMIPSRDANFLDIIASNI